MGLVPRTLRRGAAWLVLIIGEVGCHETGSASVQKSANWIQLLQWIGTTTPGQSSIIACQVTSKVLEVYKKPAERGKPLLPPALQLPSNTTLGD